MANTVWYDVGCARCARLARHLERIRNEHPGYHCRPVPPFGDSAADLLVVGLAPGKHGANASGRPFTGDHAGIMLYKMLFRYGFSNRGVSQHRGDGLRLRRARITNAVKCLPPENRPLTCEIHNCNPYLAAEINDLEAGSAVLVLGRIAHAAVLKALNLTLARHPFAHGRRHDLPAGLYMIDSYHCSRYNTQTRRLTEAMFEQVFDQIQSLLKRN